MSSRSRMAIGLLAVLALAGACGSSGGGGPGGSPAPTLSGVQPAQGPATGNTLLTLTGSNLTTGAVVTVGGVPAGGVSVVSSTQCTCLTPPGSPGPAVGVSITTAGGTATLPGAFTYLPANVGAVRARVSDLTGARLPGVQLAIGGKTRVTDAYGSVRIPDLVAANDLPAIFTADGYAMTARRVDVIAGDEVTFDVMMAPIGTTETIDATVPNIIQHAGGQISIPADSIVDATGSLVATAVVNVTTFAPSGTGYAECFPAPYLGVNASDSSESALQSYGFIEVTLEDAAGNPLQLGPASSAELEVPIDPAVDPGTPTIPLWYYDTTQGLWIEEGTATRDDGEGVYRGNVSHLTPWNLDLPLTWPAYKHVTVLDSDGKPVAGAWVSASAVAGGVIWSMDVTDANGQVELRVPPNTSILVWAQKGNVTSPKNQETSPPVGQTLYNTITLDPAQATITLRWGAIPDDLDIHVTVPTSPVRWHVHRSDMGSLIDSPLVELDLNDINGFGPETITVRRWLPGTYRCCIHNFSGQTSTDGLCNSGAIVELEVAGDPGSPRIFTPPPHDPNHMDNDTWILFDLIVTLDGTVGLQEIGTWGSTSDFHP